MYGELVRLLRPDEATALTACLQASGHRLGISKLHIIPTADRLLSVCLNSLLNQSQARTERGESYVRRTKLVPRITDGSTDRMNTENPPAGWEQGDFHSIGGTYRYTTCTVFRDPKSRRRVAASMGVMMSKGSFVMWLKT